MSPRARGRARRPLRRLTCAGALFPGPAPSNGAGKQPDDFFFDPFSKAAPRQSPGPGPAPSADFGCGLWGGGAPPRGVPDPSAAREAGAARPDSSGDLFVDTFKAPATRSRVPGPADGALSTDAAGFFSGAFPEGARQRAHEPAAARPAARTEAPRRESQAEASGVLNRSPCHHLFDALRPPLKNRRTCRLADSS